MNAIIVKPVITNTGVQTKFTELQVEANEHTLLKNLCPFIECKYVEHFSLIANRVTYDTWFDDAGKLAEKCPCVYIYDKQDWIAGNIAITKRDLSDFTEKDLQNIKKYFEKK